MRHAFVKSTLERLVREGVLDRSASLLAVAAADAERGLFLELGFTNVTISNLDTRLTGNEFAPFAWSFQDAQRLDLPDGSFDFVFVSDGLHHCDSPHRALVEMVRVARRGVLVFESRDNALMRLATRLGLSPDYELEAVVDEGFDFGGVNNTGTPNYIYRWTEREFEKTVRSFLPHGNPGFRYFYGLNLPYQVAAMERSPWKLRVLRAADLGLRAFTTLFPKQCNSFAMVALKPRVPEDLWPWLEESGTGIRFRREYAESRYRTEEG